MEVSTISEHWVGHREPAHRASGLDLSLADASEPRLLALYGAPLALIRPDQIVAWRGDGVADADALLGRLLGWGG